MFRTKKFADDLPTVNLKKNCSNSFFDFKLRTSALLSGRRDIIVRWTLKSEISCGNSRFLRCQVFIAAIVVANKFLDDDVFRKIPRVNALHCDGSYLTRLEFEFFNAIDYDLHISEIHYKAWIQTLEEIIKLDNTQLTRLRIPKPELQCIPQ